MLFMGIDVGENRFYITWYSDDKIIKEAKDDIKRLENRIEGMYKIREHVEKIGLFT